MQKYVIVCIKICKLRSWYIWLYLWNWLYLNTFIAKHMHKATMLRQPHYFFFSWILHVFHRELMLCSTLQWYKTLNKIFLNILSLYYFCYIFVCWRFSCFICFFGGEFWLGGSKTQKSWHPCVHSISCHIISVLCIFSFWVGWFSRTHLEILRKYIWKTISDVFSWSALYCMFSFCPCFT